MNFEPYPTRSAFVSLTITCLVAVLFVFLVKWLPQQNDLLSVFKILVALLLTLVLLGLAISWTVIALRLRYFLNRNGLVIHWGLAEQLIPLESIQKIIPGKDLPVLPSGGINLAGLRLGSTEIPEFGRLRFYTTTTLANSLLVVIPDQAFVVSPSRPDSFLKAWQVRQPLGPTQSWTAEARRRWPPSGSVLADPLLAWLLGLAFLACLALLGYLATILPELPPSLPIHFNAFGRADRIADKTALLTLPAAGGLVLLVNALLGSIIYRWEKVTSYLLWGSTVVMEIFLWVALFMITA